MPSYGLRKIGSGGDAESLDKLDVLHDVGHERAAEVLDDHRQLGAVELDIVERIVVDIGDNGLRHLIHEDPYPLDTLGEDIVTGTIGIHRIVETLRTIVGKDPCLRTDHPHETLALRPEIEPHHVDVELCHVANILGIAHAAHFDNHSLLLL